MMLRKVAALALVIFFVALCAWWTTRHPFEGMSIKGGYDPLGSLVFLALMFVPSRLQRLISEASVGRRTKPGLGDLVLVLGLVGAAVGMVAYGTEKMLLNLVLLPVIALELGRWRGLRERDLADRRQISESQQEIWAK